MPDPVGDPVQGICHVLPVDAVPDALQLIVHLADTVSRKVSGFSNLVQRGFRLIHPGLCLQHLLGQFLIGSVRRIDAFLAHRLQRFFRVGDRGLLFFKFQFEELGLLLHVGFRVAGRLELCLVGLQLLVQGFDSSLGGLHVVFKL